MPSAAIAITIACEMAPGHIHFWLFGRDGQEPSAGIVWHCQQSIAEDLNWLILGVECAPVVSDTAD